MNNYLSGDICGTCGKKLQDEKGWHGEGYCSITCAAESPHPLILDFPQSLEMATLGTEQGGPGWTRKKMEHWKQYVGDDFSRLRLRRESAHTIAQRLRWAQPDEYIGKWNWMATGAASGIVLDTRIIPIVIKNRKEVSW